jgi:hypothetical protein
VASNGVITFTATYVGGPFAPYSWFGTFPVGGGTFVASDSFGTINFTGSMNQVSSQVSTYATHGNYVTSMGGGSDAAHSCIGMPIVAQP